VNRFVKTELIKGWVDNAYFNILKAISTPAKASVYVGGYKGERGLKTGIHWLQ
jgi:hypothetical protein